MTCPCRPQSRRWARRQTSALNQIFMSLSLPPFLFLTLSFPLSWDFDHQFDHSYLQIGEVHLLAYPF